MTTPKDRDQVGQISVWRFSLANASDERKAQRVPGLPSPVLCSKLALDERFWFLLGCYRPNPNPAPNLSNVTVQWKIFIFCPIFLQIALLNSFFKADFKSVLRFSIGQTVLISICPLPMDRQTDGQTHSSNYNIDVEGYVEVINLHFWSNFSANSFIKSILFFSFQICA